MNYKICFLLILVSNYSIGQNDYSEILKPKLSFVSNKAEATDTSKFVVIENDTLYAKYNTYKDFYHLKDSLFNSQNFIRNYESLIFHNTNENSKKPIILKQWNCPIVLYLDENLSKNVRKLFKNFYTQINGVENLTITFTKNINHANYLIKVVDEKINGYSDDKKFKSEEEKNNYALTGATYSLLIDNNAKLYSGILKINPTNKNEEQLLKQLKQLFFLSLGQFMIIYEEESYSLLSMSYDNSSIMSNSDISLLKFHYQIIYDQIINGTTFEKLLEITKKQN